MYLATTPQSAAQEKTDGTHNALEVEPGWSMPGAGGWGARWERRGSADDKVMLPEAATRLSRYIYLWWQAIAKNE